MSSFFFLFILFILVHDRILLLFCCFCPFLVASFVDFHSHHISKIASGACCYPRPRNSRQHGVVRCVRGDVQTAHARGENQEGPAYDLIHAQRRVRWDLVTLAHYNTQSLTTRLFSLTRPPHCNAQVLECVLPGGRGEITAADGDGKRRCVNLPLYIFAFSHSHTPTLSHSHTLTINSFLLRGVRGSPDDVSEHVQAHLSHRRG